MAAADIIARLQLNAEQFSSEAGKAFASIPVRAASSASQVRNTFTSAFADVSRIAGTALNITPTKTGSLNLSGEIAQLEQAAAAADRRAIALRELAIASDMAAAAEGVDTAALRLQADAAAVAALAAEREADAKRVQIASTEAVQKALGTSTALTIQDARALDTVTHAAGNASASKAILQHVVRSTADSFAAGLPLTIIFGEQIGRLGEAAELAGGSFGKFGSFLAGPWGIAITAAVAVATPFVVKLFEAGDAAKQATAGSDGLAEAQTALGKIFDLTSGKLEHQNEQLRLNARLAAINLRGDSLKEAASSKKTFAEAGTGSIATRFLDSLSLDGARTDTALSRARSLRDSNVARIGSLVTGVQSGAISQEDALRATEKLDYTGVKVVKEDLQQAIIDAASSTVKKQTADLIDKSLDSGVLDPSFRNHAKTRAEPKARKEPSPDGLVNTAVNDAANFTAAFTDAPTFIEKADAALRKLDQDAAALEKRKGTPAITDALAKIGAAKGVIQANLTKPYDDFLKAQDRGLAVQQLSLAGRDVEAKALQEIYALTDKLGHLSDQQIAGVYQRAEQEERISRALQAQRRELDIYVQSAGDLQRTFDQFLSDLGSKPGSAFKALVAGAIGDFRSAQQKLLSNQLFGGLDQAVSDYVKSHGGQKTPADYLGEQVTDAGDSLKDFIAAVRSATDGLGGAGSPVNVGQIAGAVPTSIAIDKGALGDFYSELSASIPDFTGTGSSNAANDNGDIVVTATNKNTESLKALTSSSLSLRDTFDFEGRFITDRFEKLTGIVLPKALKESLGGLLQGASLGTFAGGAFASITGGKQSNLGSALGGAAGEVAGKAIAGTVTKGLTSVLGDGLGKALGSAVPVIGSLLGGIAGDLLGGLFTKTPLGGAHIATGSNGLVQTIASVGSNSQDKSTAKTEASAFGATIAQIAQTLGGTVTPNLALGSLGVRKSKYYFDPTPGTNADRQEFTTEAEAQQAALTYALNKGVISGISAASKRILASGQDLQTALTKALAIESVPKQLKALLDPVGAAIDTLNSSFAATVAALKEGGATADQMAQAQQLYNLELDKVKASTDSASQGLKDFLKTLDIGSNSPLSLRDQEGAAKAALQPFLDSIGAGNAIDQSKYQDAASSFLDIERQLYGSTDAYFEQFDKIQAATTQAISSIDNAVPITAGVADPFASATAASTASTASSTQASAEILAQQTSVLQSVQGLLQQIATNTGTSTSSFATGAIARAFGG